MILCFMSYPQPLWNSRSKVLETSDNLWKSIINSNVLKSLKPYKWSEVLCLILYKCALPLWS